MLPSYYLQLFNTLVNFVETGMLIVIAIASIKQLNLLTTRTDTINKRLDRLIKLTSPKEQEN